MTQKITLILMVLCLALCFLAVKTASANPGIVTADSVDAERGDRVAVPVRLSSFSGPVGGYDIYLKFDNTWLTYDSVSFIGSVAPEESNKLSGALGVGSELRFTVFPIIDSQSNVVAIDQPNGILGTIHFTVSAAAQSGYVTVDSVYREECYGTSCFIEAVQLSSADGFPIYPDYKPGGVNVKISTAVGDEGDPNTPNEFALSQNYPNPFNPSTVIRFSLPRADHVKLSVFNVIGQQVTTLVDRPMSAGQHEVIWDGASYPSGIYFYRLTHSAGAETRKMILAK